MMSESPLDKLDNAYKRFCDGLKEHAIGVFVLFLASVMTIKETRPRPVDTGSAVLAGAR